jgi:hypothetical protein
VKHVSGGRQQVRWVDLQSGERTQGEKVGFAESRDHREIVPRRGGDVGEVDEVVAQVHGAHGRVEDLAHRRDHVLAAERRAVVPEHVPAHVEDEGELVGGNRPAGGQRRLERILRVPGRVWLGHRFEHLALEHPVDGERTIGELVEARGFLVEPDQQRSAWFRHALVDAGRKAALLPGGIHARLRPCPGVRRGEQDGERESQAGTHEHLEARGKELLPRNHPRAGREERCLLTESFNNIQFGIRPP